MSFRLSPLKHLLHRLVHRDAQARSSERDPDAMSLHDWADLPPHHPCNEACAALRP